MFIIFNYLEISPIYDWNMYSRSADINSTTFTFNFSLKIFFKNTAAGS